MMALQCYLPTAAVSLNTYYHHSEVSFPEAPHQSKIPSRRPDARTFVLEKVKMQQCLHLRFYGYLQAEGKRRHCGGEWFEIGVEDVESAREREKDKVKN